MIILGLGSNLGDKLHNLRQAYLQLKQLSGLTICKISSIYISDALLPANAPVSWNQPFLNCAIGCVTTLTPLELLNQIKQIEINLLRNPQHAKWAPRIIDIDILAWDGIIINESELRIPHVELLQRPFALWPLADIDPLWIHPQQSSNLTFTAAQLAELWPSRFDTQAPYRTRRLNQRLLGSKLMGIINLTPDSFSDGNQYLQPEKALRQIEELVAAGAEIIDLGAESTAPYARPITLATEWQRLYPVLSALQKIRTTLGINPKISLDSRNPATVAKSLDFGIDWINDVTGLTQPAMRDIAQQSALPCIIMHHVTIPVQPTQHLPRSQNPVTTILAWAKQQILDLTAANISPDQLIFDPGIGFGTKNEQCFLILQEVQRFKQLNLPLLIGHSRKSFLALLAEGAIQERDYETLGIALALNQQKIDYLRVHNVQACARALAAWDASTCATV